MSGLRCIHVSDRPIAGGERIEGWWLAMLRSPPTALGLTREEESRCAAMAAPEAATLRRAAYALRRAALAERCGLQPGDIVVPNAFRTPGVDGAYSSLSHTRGAVGVVCADRPVGIDLERVDRIDDPARLAARYFAPDERDPADFAWRWTAKEALTKATGVALRAALATSVGTAAAPPFTRIIAGATLTVFAPVDGYACAVARA